MIISVPHSGTRSLCYHLNNEQWTYTYWHFGQNKADVDQFCGVADIPIRNPIDVAISWDSRYRDNDGVHSIDYMIWNFELMFQFIRGACSRYSVNLHKIEDLPLLEKSKGPPSEFRETRTSPRIEALKAFLHPHADFYKQFYDLEWLNG